MKRTKRVAILFVLLFIMTAIAPPTVAEAAGNKVSIVTDLLWADCEYYNSIQFENMPDKAKIISIKSSKPAVLEVEKQGSGIYDNLLIPHKAGKSKITVKYKVGKTTKTVSAVYTVKKFPNAYASIKLNGKKVNFKKIKYYYDVFSYKKNTVKIDLKPAKGWKIIDTYSNTSKAKTGANLKDFQYKNGKKIAIKKGYNCNIFFTLQNKKGETIQYGIRLHRGNY